MFRVLGIYNFARLTNWQMWNDSEFSLYHDHVKCTAKTTQKWQLNLLHSNLNDQNLFHSTIDAPPVVPGVSKNPDDQTEVHSGELEREDSAKIE